MIKKNTSKRKILILAGAAAHAKVVEAAKSLGFHTIVADYLDVEHSPAKKAADEYWNISITDVESLKSRCIEDGVEGVISFCIDPAQIPYQKLCDELGLPCYGTEEQFRIFTQKRLFKDFCRKNGVDVIPEYTHDEIQTGAVRYPLLIKPSVSRGSRGQRVCFSRQEAMDAFMLAKEESSDGSVIIERYMGEAEDMAFSYIVIGGKAYLLKIGDRILGDVKDNLDRQQIATMLPSRHTAEFLSDINPKVTAMIEKLGLKFGAVFLQGFYEDGKVLMYDPGLRFPGSDYDTAMKKATGFDNVSSFVRFAMTGDTESRFGNPENACLLDGKAAIILSVSCRPGIIRRIEGLEIISNIPEVISLDIRIKEGEEVPPTGDIRQRVLEFVGLFNSPRERANFVRTVYSNLKILDESGEDMIVSRIDI